MNGKRSNYDQLFISGRRCFYLDPCKDHRIDYFYPWKSFFSGFPGSVYVWCRDQLLRSHQKFIIFLLTALLFSFPVYAEDERYEFQSIQNEALYLQGYDLNEYYSNNNSDSSSIELMSSSNDLVTSNNDLITDLSAIIAFHPATSNAGESFVMRLFYDFNDVDNIESVSINRTIYSGSTGWVDAAIYDLTYYPEYTHMYSNAVTSRLPYTLNTIRINYTDGSTKDITINQTFSNDQFIDGKFTIEYIGGKMTEYLAQVAQVFTWILTHITELITFILGNPFLAVSLVLFMCGAVISFYVRIKNS